MTNMKRRVAWGIGTAVAAGAALATLSTGAAYASTAMTPRTGITVPADAAGAPTVLVASLQGRNEIPAGDPRGQAVEVLGIDGNTLSYTIAWHGLGAPTEADIHAGGTGVDGPIVVPLFRTLHPGGGLARGTVTVTDPALLSALRSNPGAFYADLHTHRFPEGAVRAQLHLLNHPVRTSGVAAVQESVILGSQIYACTPQADGTFTFTQHDVDAHLTGGIHHTFVQPDAGPPQWQAPDGSAVSGNVVTRNSNGAGNIAELNLDATQTGKPSGLLSNVVEVLRLNTLGGVAPAGNCDPQATPIVSVPYQADYLFING
jgi:hypothetical protein